MQVVFTHVLWHVCCSDTSFGRFSIFLLLFRFLFVVNKLSSCFFEALRIRLHKWPCCITACVFIRTTSSQCLKVDLVVSYEIPLPSGKLLWNGVTLQTYLLQRSTKYASKLLFTFTGLLSSSLMKCTRDVSCHFGSFSFVSWITKQKRVSIYTYLLKKLLLFYLHLRLQTVLDLCHVLPQKARWKRSWFATIQFGPARRLFVLLHLLHRLLHQMTLRTSYPCFQ